MVRIFIVAHGNTIPELFFQTYKDIAHMYTIGMIVAWYHTRKKDYLAIWIVLSIFEVICFILTKFVL
jgi:hypothetical protein